MHRGNSPSRGNPSEATSEKNRTETTSHSKAATKNDGEERTPLAVRNLDRTDQSFGSSSAVDGVSTMGATQESGSGTGDDFVSSSTAASLQSAREDTTPRSGVRRRGDSARHAEERPRKLPPPEHGDNLANRNRFWKWFLVVAVALTIVSPILRSLAQSASSQPSENVLHTVAFLERFPSILPAVSDYIQMEAKAALRENSRRGPGKVTVIYEQGNADQHALVAEMLRVTQRFLADWLDLPALRSSSDSTCLVDFALGNPSVTFDEHDAQLAERLSDSFYRSYADQKRLITLCGVQAIGNQTMRVLHGITDDQNPPYTDVLFILTAAADRSLIQQQVDKLKMDKQIAASVRKVAESVLLRLLTDRLGRDESPAMLSRIGNAVFLTMPDD